MKPEPTRAVQATTGTTVEYQVQFSTGPKGRKRLPAAPSMTGVPSPPSPAAQPTTTGLSIDVTPTREAVPLARRSAPSVLPKAARVPEPAAATRPVAMPTLATPSLTAQPAPVSRVPKITLLLVLGHHFERLVRDGAVKDYAEIARRTGLTRARVTQIANLTLLAPDIQESILELGYSAEGTEPVTERSLRTVVAKSDWGSQRLLWPRRAT